MAKQRFKVTFPMADPDDIELAKRVEKRLLELPDKPMPLQLNDVTDQDIRVTAEVLSDFPDRVERTDAIENLIASLVSTARDARKLAGVVLMFHSQIQKSQAALTRAAPIQFPPPKG